MKSMKKLVTLLLSLVMLCALALPAMADDATPSITINGAVAGHTYTAYQVFKGAYYKGDRQVPGKNAEYLSDVTWGDGVNSEDLLAALKAPNAIFGAAFNAATNAEDVAYVVANFDNQSAKLDEFARIVGKHLSGMVAGTTREVAEGETNAQIDHLAAGYYFVKDSGTINDGEIATKFLVKVVGNATVEIKATAPTIKKEIVEENGSTVNGTSANVGDKITFKLTANVPDMANFETYTFTISDKLSNGLTFNKESVEVKIGSTKLDVNTNYTLGDLDTTTNTFTVTFTKTQLANYVLHGTGATIVVTYNATLNENALTKDKETNTATLKYSNNPAGEGTGTGKTPDVPTYIYNFNIVVDKYDDTDGTNNTNKKLKDAVFVLYKKDGEDKKYYKQNADSKKVEWVSEADKTNATPQTTDVNGKATFEGLKEGTYYLEETKAPDGYNKLKDHVKVEIKAKYNADGTLDTTTTDPNFKLEQDANSHYYRVQSIANKAGAVLPSTGGIGTTIFYVLGSILALGAAVLLIAKKRMNGQDR